MFYWIKGTFDNWGLVIYPSYITLVKIIEQSNTKDSLNCLYSLEGRDNCVTFVVSKDPDKNQEKIRME